MLKKTTRKKRAKSTTRPIGYECGVEHVTGYTYVVHIHIYIYLILLTTYIPSYTLPVLVREENPKILGFNLQDYVHMYDSYIVHVHNRWPL